MGRALDAKRLCQDARKLFGFVTRFERRKHVSCQLCPKKATCKSKSEPSFLSTQFELPAFSPMKRVLVIIYVALLFGAVCGAAHSTTPPPPGDQETAPQW